MMVRNIFMFSLTLCLIWACPQFIFSQDNPAPKNKTRRMTGVIVEESAVRPGESPAANNRRGAASGKTPTAMEKRLESENTRLEAERVAREQEITAAQEAAAEEAKKKQEELDAAQAAAEKAAAETAALQKRAEEEEKIRAAAETARLEAERIAAEERTKEMERMQAQIAAARLKMIEVIARRLGFLSPEKAFKVVPADAQTNEQLEAVLQKAAYTDPRLSRGVSFCDLPHVGKPLNLELTADDTFGSLLEDLRLAFGVNFLPDAELLPLPVRVNVQDVPWDVVLCQQLSILDIEARYVGENVISLVKRSKLLALEDSRRKTAPTKTEYIKLKYLRPVSGGQTNLAGKSAGTANVESLEQAIQKILSAGGDTRGSISRIPGRAEFFITATDAQFEQIRQVIGKADRPTYRVDVYGLVYTINENRLKDVGSQLSAVINTGGRVSGLTTLPSGQTGGGGGTGGTGTGGQSGSFLGSPFSQPGGLQAGAANTILAARASLGLVDFNYQLSLLEQLGIARRVEKPFISVKDGSTGTFENGTQIPVVLQALNNLGGSGGGGSIEFINAGTTLSVTPQVVETDSGVNLVNLTLRLESNTPDLSIQTTGGVPSVNSRRIQNEITLAPGQAFISGGSNDTGDSNTVSRTPGLGELPVIGNLFKRKTKSRTDNKLYFAVWVQVSLDDGSSPVETDTLNTTFPKPPPMDAPLVLPGKKP